MENWAEPERNAVQQLFVAVFDDALNVAIHESISPDAEQVDTWLCAIASAYTPLTPFMQRLSEAPFSAVLAALYKLNREALSQRKLQNPFWENNRPAMALLVAWLTGDKCQAQLG
jgi:hypothetical protein